ncbi:MAG: tryptophan synthase subunit beta [Candidatus Eremiobacteraeota bacterium]|nr:tryptophan synthase subunit beta [Candidatus Eremiobacteraeota bacterium]
MHKPDERGYFGDFGGRWVPEVLVAPLAEVEKAMNEAFGDPTYWEEFHALLSEYVGRPSALTVAHRFGQPRNATIAFKREDLNHTGAHKINNTIGQALLAKRMGKQRLIAETGAGQHGVAVATIGAKLGIPVDVYMGAVDVERQALNVYLMRLLGATVHPVTGGTQTLKDATNEAFRVWAAQCEDTFYVIGSVVGAHPYPFMVREFQRIVCDDGRIQSQGRFGRLPTDIVACVGGGSNALGIFTAFIDDDNVNLWGVEAAGKGTNTAETAAPLAVGSVGVLHGSRSFLLQTAEGQVKPTHSISAGLDYPGVGPEHAYLKQSGRAKYVAVTDDEALAAFHACAASEGIIAALESAHALAYAQQLAKERGEEGLIVVCMSGRGDKDVTQIEKLDGKALVAEVTG